VLASTPNDGSEVVTVPNITTSTGRTKVESVARTLTSQRQLQHVKATVPPNPVATSATAQSGCDFITGIVADQLTGSCGGTFVGTGNPLVVSPASTTTYFSRSRRTSDGAVSTGCGSVTVTVNPVATDPTNASSDRTNFCSDDTGDQPDWRVRHQPALVH
jgi:hypothetical protein